MSRKKQYLKSIYENGKSIDFVEYLLRMNSLAVNEYAKAFCNKVHLKPIERNDKEEEEHMKDIIRIVHTSWLDKDL